MIRHAEVLPTTVLSSRAASKYLGAFKRWKSGLCMRVSQFGSCHLSTAWLGFDADLERGCVLVPEAKLAALRAMLQIIGVATHLNAGFIILPLTIEVREKVERNDYLASTVLMKANIPQNIQYDVNSS